MDSSFGLRPKTFILGSFSRKYHSKNIMLLSKAARRYTTQHDHITFFHLSKLHYFSNKLWQVNEYTKKEKHLKLKSWKISTLLAIAGLFAKLHYIR
jgi:hypothetical protein